MKFWPCARMRKCEDRLEKLTEMHEKLSAKLADPNCTVVSLSQILKFGTKICRSRRGNVRAETLWVTAQEKLDTADTRVRDARQV